MGQASRRVLGQTRQAHGRGQGQEEGQEKALLQAWTGALEHVRARRGAWIQCQKEGEEKAPLINVSVPDVPLAELRSRGSFAGRLVVP